MENLPFYTKLAARASNDQHVPTIPRCITTDDEWRYAESRKSSSGAREIPLYLSYLSTLQTTHVDVPRPCTLRSSEGPVPQKYNHIPFLPVDRMKLPYIIPDPHHQTPKHKVILSMKRNTPQNITPPSFLLQTPGMHVAPCKPKQSHSIRSCRS